MVLGRGINRQKDCCECDSDAKVDNSQNKNQCEQNRRGSNMVSKRGVYAHVKESSTRTEEVKKMMF